MTEQITIPPEAGNFEGLILEGEATRVVEHSLPCWVRHPDAGGRCERPAVAEVYHLPFCEAHGAEAKAGALAEMYHDAEYALERLDHPHAPSFNPAASRCLRDARAEMTRRTGEAGDAQYEAVRRAYPVLWDRVCTATKDYDYFSPTPGDGASPVDVYTDARMLLHKLMRLSAGEGADWLTETLEYQRESANAQLAAALEDYERKTGRPA